MFDSQHLRDRVLSRLLTMYRLSEPKAEITEIGYEFEADLPHIVCHLLPFDKKVRAGVYILISKESEEPKLQ